MSHRSKSSKPRKVLGLIALVAGITLNVAIIVATSITALNLAPAIFRPLENVVPVAGGDLSEDRLGQLLRQQVSEFDCAALEGVIAANQSAGGITEVLNEVGIDIYLARDALEEIEAPELGFASKLTEQVELTAGRVLAEVLDFEPEFENHLAFETMVNRATLELVSFCALEGALGEALATQRQADTALERLKELADEAAWYPRGFTRSLDNLAWGWSSDSGSAPCENCVYWKVTLVSRDGCLGGGLVQIMISDGDAELTEVRKTWPRLEPMESVIAEFPYQQLNPDLTAQVTFAECFAHEQP